ncbi:hypothetical protein AB0K12_25490 [Nonomuraea sp. NPDC049419]|uniref:hypothetical protein n=1 Tax=Nonomuraea sp. NPDC049419 TaxID=3155772 RepID=UPI003444A6D0
MPKFQELSAFAEAMAPVINAANVNVHASATRAVADLSTAYGLTPGLLSDLRFSLPLRPLTRRGLGVLFRYGDVEGDLLDHLRQGALVEDPDGVLRLTEGGRDFIHGLYEVHAAAVERVWAGSDLGETAELVGRVVDAAERLPGGAFELVSPPYEPEGASPGLLLFNRLAVLRYHRADAHAAAWQAAGLSAAEIVGLMDGPLRAGIEADTNRRAGRIYRALSERERDTLYETLLKLI